MTFVDDVIDIDEEDTPNLRLESKHHTLFETKMAKINALFFLSKRLKQNPLGSHTYLAHPRGTCFTFGLCRRQATFRVSIKVSTL